MIIREYYGSWDDGTKLYRTYSDRHKKILQVDTGEIYDEAVDVEWTNHTYVETEEDLDPDNEGDGGFLSPQNALDLIFGDVSDD